MVCCAVLNVMFAFVTVLVLAPLTTSVFFCYVSLCFELCLECCVVVCSSLVLFVLCLCRVALNVVAL